MYAESVKHLDGEALKSLKEQCHHMPAYGLICRLLEAMPIGGGGGGGGVGVGSGGGCSDPGAAGVACAAGNLAEQVRFFLSFSLPSLPPFPPFLPPSLTSLLTIPCLFFCISLGCSTLAA
jgi:hypothetical protein